MRPIIPLAPALALLLVAGAARGEIVISELMYNPASDEGTPNDVEWIEIFNAGQTPVEIGRWYFEDEDGKTGPLPPGLIIKPAQAIVLIPDDQTPEDFRAAWGRNIAVYALSGWNRGGMGGLANTASATNEVLQLKDEAGNLKDQVNYQTGAEGWPASTQGPSIFLLPGHISTGDNDLGKHWAHSEAGKLGATRNTVTPDYDGSDTGSPGVVVTQVETAESRE